MRAKITILSLMIAMTGCASSTSNELVGIPVLTPNALDKNELLQLFTGSTVYQNGNDVVQVGFYSEDNTMTGNVWGSREDHIDKGNWIISDAGQFCIQWTGLWSKGEGQNCYSLYPGDGEDQYMMISDSAKNVSVFKTGIEVITITPSNIDEFE